MTRFKLGVVGLGEGRSVLSAATHSPRWEVHALCDLDETVLRARAAEFGVGRTTRHFDDLLADGAIDVVGIYVPDPLHGAFLIRALRAGKHVVCTKPLFDSLAPAREALEAQRQSGRQVLVGQSTRFFEPMIRQRQDYEAGKHGPLVTVEAHYHHDLRQWAARAWPARVARHSPGDSAGGSAGGGGSRSGLNYVFAGLSHPVDLVRWYLPGVVEAMAYGHRSASAEALGLAHPDTIHAILKCGDGRIARVSGCYGSADASMDGQDMISCVVRGEGGTSHANYLQLRYYTNFAGEGERKHTWPERAAHYFRFEGFGYHAGEFQNYLDYFAECLEQGRPASPDLPEGVGTVAVMAAIDRSLRDGRPVRVADLLAEQGVGDLTR